MTVEQKELIDDAYERGRIEALRPIAKIIDDYICDRIGSVDVALAKICLCITYDEEEDQEVE